MSLADAMIEQINFYGDPRTDARDLATETHAAARLLICACSATKTRPVYFDHRPRPAPALELYDGPAWRTIRAHAGPEVAVWALSAEHGLFPAETEIRYYDRKLRGYAEDVTGTWHWWDHKRDAFEWRYAERFAAELEAMAPDAPILLFGSELYADFLDHIATPAPVVWHYDKTSGGIGEQLGELRRWLTSGRKVA